MKIMELKLKMDEIKNNKKSIFYRGSKTKNTILSKSRKVSRQS